MSAEDEQKTRAERARAIGLFRYQLIREAADPVHSTKARGRMIHAIAEPNTLIHSGVGPGLAADHGSLDPGLADRWVRRAGPQPAAVEHADAGGSDGAGGGAAARTLTGPRPGSAGSCALSWAGPRTNGPCNGTSPGLA